MNHFVLSVYKTTFHFDTSLTTWIFFSFLSYFFFMNLFCIMISIFFFNLSVLCTWTFRIDTQNLDHTKLKTQHLILHGLLWISSQHQFPWLYFFWYFNRILRRLKLIAFSMRLNYFCALHNRQCFAFDIAFLIK